MASLTSFFGAAMGVGLALTASTANGSSVTASQIGQTINLQVFNAPETTDLSGFDLTTRLFKSSTGQFFFRFNNESAQDDPFTAGASIKQVFFEDGLSTLISSFSAVDVLSADNVVEFDEPKQSKDPPGGQTLNPAWKKATLFTVKEGNAPLGVGLGEYLDINITLKNTAGLDDSEIDQLALDIISIVRDGSPNRIAVHIGSVGENEELSFSAISVPPPPPVVVVEVPEPVGLCLLGGIGLLARRRRHAVAE